MSRELQQRGIPGVLVGPGETVPAGKYGLIVDGLFGIGLTRPPEGRYAQWIATANRLAERDRCPLLALVIAGPRVDRGAPSTARGWRERLWCGPGTQRG